MPRGRAERIGRAVAALRHAQPLRARRGAPRRRASFAPPALVLLRRGTRSWWRLLSQSVDDSREGVQGWVGLASLSDAYCAHPLGAPAAVALPSHRPLFGRRERGETAQRAPGRRGAAYSLSPS